MRQLIVIITLSLFSAPLFAIGLGDINLKSRLNQQYKAQIPVVINGEVDADEITVKLASIEHFKRAGIKRSGVVISFNFEPKRTDSGQMVIQVSSDRRVLEPMVGFIIEVEHRGSRSLREYTTLLGLPDS